MKVSDDMAVGAGKGEIIQLATIHPLPGGAFNGLGFATNWVGVEGVQGDAEMRIGVINAGGEMVHFDLQV